MKPWENFVSDSLSQSNSLNKNIIEGKLSDKQGASSKKNVQDTVNKLNEEIRTKTEETKPQK